VLIYSILFLLLSIAVSSEGRTEQRRDKSILYSRVAIIILAYSTILSSTSLHLEALGLGIGLYGGLFHVTSISQIFHIFIFIISAVILQLTAFYPRKI
jgi:NADH-ubiquinone oxidoreductase chain 2